LFSYRFEIWANKLYLFSLYVCETVSYADQNLTT
jgi:hypothetical protein